ncbi:MAG: hypothetical protein IIC64_08595 [SAR324 cluster bacterium]|nr:hypothetical protein [SAR324 cluster bacterium]
MKVYLAAPLFTQAHRHWNRAFAEALTAAWSESTALDDQLDVILPQFFRAPEGADSKERFDALVQTCIVAIEQADALVTVLEGADADSGGQPRGRRLQLLRYVRGGDQRQHQHQQRREDLSRAGRRLLRADSDRQSRRRALVLR